MRCKKPEPIAPVFGGCPADPAYDSYMKKCMKKYPFLHKMIDYIVDCKIAALRAEMYQMCMYQPMSPGMMSPGMMSPGMMCPGMPGPGMPYSGMMGPGGEPPFRPGYPMMPM